MNERDAILQYVSRLSGGRPVRWADEQTSKGDFDGREWTLEIFEVPSDERRKLHQLLWSLKKQSWSQLRVALTFICHTPENTARFYPWVRGEESRHLTDSAQSRVARLQAPRFPGRPGRLDHDLLSPDPIHQRAA